MAIITTFFPDDKEQYIGILEGGIGIGMLAGPLIGAFLNQVGGYAMPFWTVASVCVALYPLLLHTVKYIQLKEDAYNREHIAIQNQELRVPIDVINTVAIREVDEKYEQDSPIRRQTTETPE